MHSYTVCLEYALDFPNKSAFPCPFLKDLITKYLNLQKCQDSCRSPATHKGRDICIGSKCRFCSQITLHPSGAVIPYVHRKKAAVSPAQVVLTFEVKSLFYSFVIGSYLNLKKSTVCNVAVSSSSFSFSLSPEARTLHRFFS